MDITAILKYMPLVPMGLSGYYLYKRPSDWKIASTTGIFSAAMLVSGLAQNK